VHRSGSGGADEIGDNTAVELREFASADSFEKFRAKARAFLCSHQDHLSIRKLRLNEPLTALDLQELEKMLVESGALNPEHLAKAKAESEGLGLFVRSLVGLERDAAKKGLNAFTARGTLTANQIEFVNLVVDQLTARGAMPPELLYESPFTDLSAQGPDGVFSSPQVDELLELLSQIRARAIA
jgi:type I restriction enzyme, R subunit